MKRILVTGLSLVLTLLNLTAQSSTPQGEKDRLFYLATEQFQRGEFAGSFRAVELWLNETPSSTHLEEAQFIKAASSWELNRSETSLLLIRFLKDWPASPYAENAFYLLGCSAMESGQYEDAMAYFNRCPESALTQKERTHYRFRRAFTAMQQGDNQTARTLFSQMTEGANRYAASAGFFIAYINYSSGKAQEALSGFAPYADNDQLNATIPCFNVQLLYATGKFTESIKAAKEALPTTEDIQLVTELARIIAAASFDIKAYDDARQAYIVYLSLGDTAIHSTDIYRIGVLNYIADEYDKAISRLSGIADRNDALGQSAVYHLGLCYLKNNNKEQARLCFQQASRDDYDKATKEKALYNYAVLCYETDFTAFNEQVNAFQRFLELFPTSELVDKVNGYLAEALLSSNDYKNSLAVIERVKKPDAKLLNTKARLLFLLGVEAMGDVLYTKALTYFDQSLALTTAASPVSQELFYWRGEARYQLQRLKDAQSDYKRFIESPSAKQSKAWLSAIYGLGYCSFDLHNYADALSRFESFTLSSGAEKDSRYTDVLNRLGDCHYMLKRYEKAGQLYQKADKSSADGSDYAVYQEAMMLGLQKKYQAKLALLNGFDTRFESSNYLDDAVFEAGKTHASLKEWDNAITTYSLLMEEHASSPLARKAGLQIALIHVNNQNRQQAIEAYKQVIARYPKSQEAQTALEDLKALYVSSNTVSAYIDYTKSLDNVVLGADEQDSLTYLAAEQQLMEGNDQAAITAFTEYLQQFPNGIYVTDSRYNLAKLYLIKEDVTAAIDHLKYVAAQKGDSHQIESLQQLSTLYVDQSRYQEAVDQYIELAAVAPDKKTNLAAQLSLLACYAKLSKEKELVTVATTLLKEKDLDANQMIETRYFRAKSYLATTKTDLAKADLLMLSKEVKTVFGAESRFLLAEVYFKQNNLKEAEKLVNQFIQDGSPHAYWLAHSFLLLADINMQRKDDFQAKQYLLSLKDNYKADDDIAGLIEARLNKISQRNN